MSLKSPMIRLAPLQFSDLPSHPDFGQEDATSTRNARPDLLAFTLPLLDQARSLLLPTNFNLAFKSHSWKPSPPSNNEVEVLSTEIPVSDLQSLTSSWSTPSNPRPQPRKFHDEHWYARRSYHRNQSSKRNASGTASYDEFVYGLRDEKSKREMSFTPDLYDARKICDWSAELNSLFAGFRRSDADAPAGTTSGTGSTTPITYTNLSMTIHEMCHKMPNPVSPRCFPTLVLTASVSDQEFIAVSLPVDLSSYKGSFYSSGRNQKEGEDHQRKKGVTLGEYVAVERVISYKSPRGHEHAKASSVAGVGDGKGGKEGEGSVSTGTDTTNTSTKPKATGHKHLAPGDDEEEEIEWIMATASRARGNIPMTMQRMGVPGAIAKDVGLFLQWIRGVSDDEVLGKPTSQA